MAASNCLVFAVVLAGTCAVGQSQPKQAAEAPPISQAEIERDLKAGVSSDKLISLVKQDGVDFALTDPIENDLRAAGANSELLLAIARNRHESYASAVGRQSHQDRPSDTCVGIDCLFNFTDDSEPGAKNEVALGLTFSGRRGTGAKAVISYVKGASVKAAGLREGDIITSIGDHSVDTIDSYFAALPAFKAKQTIKLGFLRDGKSHFASVLLSDRKEMIEALYGGCSEDVVLSNKCPLPPEVIQELRSQNQIATGSGSGVVGLWSCTRAVEYFTDKLQPYKTEIFKFQLLFSENHTYKVTSFNEREQDTVSSLPGSYTVSAASVILGEAGPADGKSYGVQFGGGTFAFDGNMLGRTVPAEGAPDVETCARGDYLTAELGKRWAFKNTSSHDWYIDINDGEATSTGNSCEGPDKEVINSTRVKPGEVWVQFCGSHQGLCYRIFSDYHKKPLWFGAVCRGSDAVWKQHNWIQYALTPGNLD